MSYFGFLLFADWAYSRVPLWHLLLFLPPPPVQGQSIDPLKSRQQVDLERAHFLVTQAFQEDEKGNGDEAIELYSQAVELCIQTVCSAASRSLSVLCTPPGVLFDLVNWLASYFLSFVSFSYILYFSFLSLFSLLFSFSFFLSFLCVLLFI